MGQRSSMPDQSRRTRFARTSAQVAIILVVVLGLAAVALGRIAPTGSSGGAADPRSSAEAGPSTSVAALSARSPTPAGSTTTCKPSRPEPVFVPTRSAPAVPPAYYKSSWFGTARLWTMVSDDGEIWRNLPTNPTGLSQKTFWWSEDWDSAAEPEPLITVTGRRLDAPGTFSFGPGTNAGTDFGTAMLVGIDVPTGGCWEITGRYHAATLAYTVLVEDSQAPRP
jgi:hypothetical protein